MVIEETESQVLEMLAALKPCADAWELNGPAGYMLAQELFDLKKPMDAITLGEVRAASERVDQRYHRMMDRFKSKGAA